MVLIFLFTTILSSELSILSWFIRQVSLEFVCVLLLVFSVYLVGLFLGSLSSVALVGA